MDISVKEAEKCKERYEKGEIIIEYLNSKLNDCQSNNNNANCINVQLEIKKYNEIVKTNKASYREIFEKLMPW
jgi:hypothetical protein